jgi:hypothetical protein
MASLFKSPKAPTPMNADAIGQTQQGENTRSAFQSAAFNRVNQSGPFGSVSYSQSGTDASGNPIFSQQTSLDPNELAYRDQQRSTAFGGYGQGLAGIGASANRFGGAADQLMQSGQQRLGAFNSPANLSSQAAFDQAYSTASANMEPRMARSTAAAENRLRNQGLDPTSEAYKSQMNDLALQQNESRNDLTTKLQGQLFNQGLQGRQQDFSEASGLYGLGAQAGQTQMQGYQQIGSLGRSGMVDAATAPGVSDYAQINTGGPVDYAGLNTTAYNQQNEQYKQQMAQRNAMIGGLAGIGGSLITMPMGGGMSLGGTLAKRYIG